MRFALTLWATLLSLSIMIGRGAAWAEADTITVAGVYTQSVEQKWDARLHEALSAAESRGEIEYVFSEKVANTDYLHGLRGYAERGVALIAATFALSLIAKCRIPRD